MKFVVIIPARLASTRLPRKVLLDIAGKPVLQHVYEKACKSSADNVVIATDDDEVRAAATAFSAPVCMTSSKHRSGTDRINEAVLQLGLDDDTVVVNVQGDEPMLPPENIDQVANLLATRPQQNMATLYAKIHRLEDILDPNVVKLVKDVTDTALYFSRAPIPWNRKYFRVDQDAKLHVDAELEEISQVYYKHIGIYAYRAQFIRRFVEWPQGELELTESLEQLRVIGQGEGIAVAEACRDPGIGIDTQGDLERARAHFEKME